MKIIDVRDETKVSTARVGDLIKTDKGRYYLVVEDAAQPPENLPIQLVNIISGILEYSTFLHKCSCGEKLITETITEIISKDRVTLHIE